MRLKYVTYDEGCHIKGGALILTSRNFAFDNKKPPLVKVIEAMPSYILFRNKMPIDFYSQMLCYYPYSNRIRSVAKNITEEEINNEKILYKMRNTAFLFRLPILFLGSLLGFLVFRWSQK